MYVSQEFYVRAQRSVFPCIKGNMGTFYDNYRFLISQQF